MTVGGDLFDEFRDGCESGSVIQFASGGRCCSRGWRGKVGVAPVLIALLNPPLLGSRGCGGGETRLPPAAAISFRTTLEQRRFALCHLHTLSKHTRRFHGGSAMSEVNHGRRRFLARSAMAVAAVQCGVIGCAETRPGGEVSKASVVRRSAGHSIRSNRSMRAF